MCVGLLGVVCGRSSTTSAHSSRPILRSMSQLEYLIALISIIVGLGLTDLAQSLRELVRPGRRVQWHWLPLLWAANVFLIVVQLWWASFTVLQEEIFSRAVAFLPFLLFFVGLYLACAFSLPDLGWRTAPAPKSDDNAELDLEAFYFSEAHRRWFFGLLIGLVLLSQAITIPLFLLRKDVSPTVVVANAAQNGALAALLGTLIATDRRWVHAAVALLLFGGLIYTLTAGVTPIG